MSTGEDEPSSGLNGRLRPRKSTIPSPQIPKTIRKPDSKPAQDKPKRTTTPSKASPNKLDDLTDKSDSTAQDNLCPYCDKTFFSKQAVSKHVRRIHILPLNEDNVINCLFCNNSESDANDIIRHMVDNHPNQYFACFECHTRFPSTTALAEHKLNVCEKQKLPYRNKLRQKTTPKTIQKTQSNQGEDDFENDDKNYTGQTFNGIVISCELKPSHPNDPIDIEDNITTNLILPSSKNLGNPNILEKNAIIVLDDLQWNKRIPPNFSFHNTDADQILSRLGVVHRSPRAGENNKKDWLRHIEDSHQKFEKCFDTSFYTKVASNVQENLTKFLDGSFNFNPDPENTIKTRKAKNIVAINTVEGFPILLASEQFSRNVFDGYLPRSIAPKHKWKWDNLESDKNFMSPEQIKRDSHTNNCIVTLVSSLDIWTQLCMRRKFEEKFTTSSTEKKNEKQSIIGKELKEILESRELPTSSSQVVKYTSPQLQARDDSDFPASLGLVPNAPNYDLKPAVLSGEWVRPRCYVCCACGAQTRDSRALSSHISTQHPNAQIQHYEIVGEVLLNSDILKHLYVPPSQLNNRTRPLRGFRECTKCGKGISLEDLHQHMLDCAGDTPTVRRKCRYRPFGVRKRRPRLPDNTIRKEMRKDIRHPRHNRKTLMRPRPKIRTEVGDAETIRKMLADLPAKRHRAIVNPLKPILRPRRKLNKQRSKLVIKKRALDELVKKPKSADMSQKGNNTNQETEKSSNDSEKPNNNSVPSKNHASKRLSSGVLGHKNTLHKKNTVAKNRRKTFVTKKSATNIESSDVPGQPTDSDSGIPGDQMSMENNSQRINVNDGSFNTREHGNSNNGSNNKDNERPGCSGQNSNSRDSFAPSQHVPLKHSIARLTASSETHDKSVQFHHLFLVQQECNDTTQHLPSGQKALFENEAVVTKLDKPPLHFNHSDLIDLQGLQRNKLNKPRKGLNDCIAMLKNKLVEPNSDSAETLPGHVSVQCGSDEPLGPEPVVIERGHSTADIIELNTIESNTIEANIVESDIVESNIVESDIVESNIVESNTIESNTIDSNTIDSNTIDLNTIESNAIEPNVIESNTNESNTNESNTIESNRIESNIIESDQRTLQMFYPNKTVDDIPLNYETTNRVTRRSSTRQSSRRDKFMDVQTNNDFILWNQFYYNKQMLPTAKSNYKYNKRETTRRRSVVSTEELLLQHAMNMELLANSNRNFNNVTNYQFPTIPTPPKTPRKTRQDSNKSRPSTTAPKTKNPDTSRSRQKKVIDSNKSRNVNQKSPDLDLSPAKRINDRRFEKTAANNANVTPIIDTAEHYYLHGRIEDKTVDINMDKTVLHPSNIQEDQLCTNVCQNMQMIPYPNEYDVVPVHYNMHIDTTLPAPLDLSHKTIVPESRHYVTEEPYCPVSYDNYETLDLSNRYMNNVPEKVTCVNDDEVVDLRVNYTTQSLPSRSTPLQIENDATDLSYGHAETWVSEADDCIPTDLSMRRNDIPPNSYEKRRLYELSSSETLVSENNVIQDLSHPARHGHEICMVMPQRDDLDNEEPTDLSNWRIESRSNLPVVCMSEERHMHINVCSSKSNHNDEEIPADLSGKNKDTIHNGYYIDEQGIPQYLESAANNNHKTGSIIIENSLDSEQMINAHYKMAARIPLRANEPRNIIAYSESVINEPQNMTNNITSPSSVTCNLTTISSNNENNMHSDMNYIISEEMPLSLSTKTTDDTNVPNIVYRESRPRDYEYENTTSTCALPHLKEKDVLNSNTNDNISVNTPTAHTLPGQVTGTLTTYKSSSIVNESNKIVNRKLSCENEVYELKKNLSQEKSPAPTYRLDTENKNVDTSKDNTDKNNLDQDPETARKIAMLPKELVEILGNMPVDHRNQLLNVLPQYVSSSTSPVLLPQDNESFRRDSISVTGTPSPTLISHKLEIDYKGSPQNVQFTETSPTAVSSSILLTPPTPHLSDRHSNQSHENNEIKVIEYRRKSRMSLEEDSSQKNVNTENAHKTTDEYDQQDRIIDLTGDETIAEAPDVSYSSDQFTNSTTCPSKDISSSIVTPKTKALKTNSDKTASLRAVRIKTSSERQRSLLPDNTKITNSSDSSSDTDQKNKSSDVTSRMAIQQAEISSTQHRSAIRICSTSARPDSSPEEQESIITHIKNNTKDTKADLDSNYSISDKQNVVSSSILKETHCELMNEVKSSVTCHVIKNDSSKISESFNTVNEISSESNKDKNNSKEVQSLTKNKGMAENVSLISSGTECQLSIEDEDSEDDVTLAVIVKQKHRELNATCKDQVLYEKENTSIENKKSEQKTSDKISSDYQKQVLLSCNKTISVEIPSLCESQPLKKATDTNTNNFDSNENMTKEKGTYSKKKGRKGRRVNILGTTQYVEQQENLCSTNEIDNELDINKENNVSSEIAKNVEMTDDSSKTKSSEVDNNRSTSTNTTITNEKDVTSNIPLRKEKTKVMLNLSSDFLSCDNVNVGDPNSDTINEGHKNTTIAKVVNDNSKGDFCENKQPYSINTASTATNKDEKLGDNSKPQSSDNSNEISVNETNDLNNPSNINQVIEAKVTSRKVTNIESGVESNKDAEAGLTHTTPLRRSRRGKSLFIDSNSIINDNTLHIDNSTEHRAPLTKKQLIFSKLLQDEENHNKPILNTPIKQSPDKNIQHESQKDHSSDDELNKLDNGENKTNKRKKSPQSKRKCKKKKSLNLEKINEKLNTTQEVHNDLERVGTNNIASDKMIESVSSDVKSHEVDDKNVTDGIVNNQTSIEKRKSTSPDRDDSLSISKPKKLKLIDEKTVVSNIKIPEKEIESKEIRDNNSSTAVIARNTTCYNKAIRRARSKSVVVKSSGSDLYDPYDIDLEVMLDKTEPFVRTETSPKTRFSSFKSTVAVKTRKLSKTAPSAIIDILPSEATPSAVDTENDKLDAEKTKNSTEYNNNSNVNTKDGSSDSDESTKSDVPLKKYVEEKEKKLTEVLSQSESVEKSNTDETCGKSREKSKLRKRNKQSQSINNKEPKVISNKAENEEELRSEQFMESFGFFSERKPRKSNLLATKKISETFNLIDNDDAYFASKERVAKKSVNDNKKDDQVKTKPIATPPKKATKRGRKKRRRVKIKPSFCDVCKKVFRRWDNYVRHLLSLYHISRLCEIELKVKTVLIEEEPNYLLAYRQQLNRLKVLQNKIAKRKKNCLSTADIVLPTLEEILADVKRTIREQQLSRRSLSRDEALFIDCCEMLKESHKNNGTTVTKRIRQCNSFNCAQACEEELALLEKSILDDRCDIKTDEEMDSAAAKKILESEEVRNLENDLISNLKEANGIKGPLTGVQIDSSAKFTDSITDSHTLLSNYEMIEESARPKYKRHIDMKEKIYSDIVENIDMFEDKFDKIKRKCRSQAAAAKQIQTNVESNARYNNRKKSEKKKINNRRGYNTSVPTKAALKGFDGVKVSILTSDIDMSAIIPPVEKVHRKKRKSNSKKKRNRTNSEKSGHRDSDHCSDKSPQKKVDVYEFMDTEDTEVFEFRPSTLMERFKSINNKDMPSTSKSTNENEFEISSESGSDGDDFVYMSDDYVCSDDETENSILSCELGNGKGISEPAKISSPIKRKETTEKNAVMGKIFKNNAVRTERRSPKRREIVKPKANLDQLFDSLLEDEPKASAHKNDDFPIEKEEVPTSRVYLSLSPQKDDQSRFNKSAKRYDQALSITSDTGLSQKYSTPSPTLHPSLSSFAVRRKSTTPPTKLETNVSPVPVIDAHGSSSLKRNDDYKKCETSKVFDLPKETHTKKYEPLTLTPENYTVPNTDNTLRRRSDDFCYDKHKLRDEFYKEKSDKKKKEERKYDCVDYGEESFDQLTPEDAGVARQRARRKCTVGKQNVLAETWSSESEPDGAPPRPNSAESVIGSSGRKKKGKKKDGHSSGSRKAGRLVSVKKQESESRVGSSNRSASSGVRARPRSPYYWSEGDDEQEHPQQHGWIVGDSHKKLVTMLAHAKGRKRSGDEKRHLLE